MSIFIRDELNTSGTTLGDGQSPDVNPHYIGRTQRDILDTSGTTPGDGQSPDVNPDFSPMIIHQSNPVQNQHSIELKEGWVTIAYPGLIKMDILEFLRIFYGQHATSSRDDMFDFLVNQINIWKDNEGRFMWPAFSFDGLGILKPGQGYIVKVEDVDSSSTNNSLYGEFTPNLVEYYNQIITGEIEPTFTKPSLNEREDLLNLVENVVITPENEGGIISNQNEYNVLVRNIPVPITTGSSSDTFYTGNQSLDGIKEGWNTIGYTSLAAVDALSSVHHLFFGYCPGFMGSTNIPEPTEEEMFLSLSHYVNIMKDNEGRFIWPDFQFNGLGDLIPGQGYIIRLKDNRFHTSSIHARITNSIGEVHNIPPLADNFQFPPASGKDLRPLIDGGPS